MRDRTGLDDEAPLSASDALAIIDRERGRTARTPGVYFVLWGAVILVVGVVYFLAGRGALGYGTASLTMGVLIVAAMVASAVIGFRLGRGVSGPSSRQGAMYGLAWLVGWLALTTVIVGLAQLGLDGVQMGRLIPVLYGFLAGVMYMLSGAMWRHVPSYVLGAVVQVVAVACLFTPVPWNALVLGIGVGGSVLAVGCAELRAVRR